MRLWPKGGLWRHPDFLKLWSAETISQVGSQVTGLALPLVAIITLDVSAFEVALLGVIEFAPFILISLPAGVWVDRHAPEADPHRRRLRPGGAAGDDSHRVRGRRADDLAALRRRLPLRRADGVLRRRVSVVPACTRRARPARGRQLEARDLALRRATRRTGTRRRADPGAEGAAGDSPRRPQLPGLRVLRSRHPQA